MKHPSPRMLLAAALAAAAAAAMMTTQTRCSGPRPKNLILLTLDTLRGDHISAVPGGKAATPALDALAARGVLFENAWSPIPITLPAHASIFYGLPPHAIKNYNNGQVIRSRRNRPSIASAFRKAGFDTAAFVSLGVLTPDYGLDEGFDTYEASFPPDRWYLTAEELNSRLLPWLEGRRDKPFFLWAHYSDPHDPYAPPGLPDDLELSLNGRTLDSFRIGSYATFKIDLDLKPGDNTLVFKTFNPFQKNPTQFMARLDLLEFLPQPGRKEVFWEHTHKWYVKEDGGIHFLMNGAVVTLKSPGPERVTMRFRGKLILNKVVNRDYYRREVEYMDGRVGEFLAALDRLGLKDSTAVIAAGDHGEGLGEYLSDFGDPHYGHIHYLQKVYCHVPLIVVDPSTRRAGLRRSEPVTLVDIAPTLFKMFGLKPFDGLPGRDLIGLKKGSAAPVFLETFRPEAYKNRFALLDGPWHMILSPEDGHRDLYHLGSDPREETNVWDTPGVPPDKGRRLAEGVTAFAREVLKNMEDVAIDKKAEEMLKSLGYLR